MNKARYLILARLRYCLLSNWCHDLFGFFVKVLLRRDIYALKKCIEIGQDGLCSLTGTILIKNLYSVNKWLI